MKALHPTEHEVLTLARALVGQLPAGTITPLLYEDRAAPKALGPTAMGLLQATLAQGVVLELNRRGGWQPRKHLSARGVTSGRLWERHPDVPLRFTAASFQLVRSLLGAAHEKVPNRTTEPLLTSGDEALGYLACHLLLEAEVPDAVARSPALTRSPLCWLGFADRMGGATAPTAADFARLTTEHAVVLEALQRDLALRWEAMERGKSELNFADEMLRLARAQEAVTSVLLPALDAARRWDLAFFLVDALGRLLTPGAGDGTYTVDLAGKTVAERSEGRKATGAALRALLQIARWVEGWRGTPFFEDTYQSAQAMLAAWEGVGDAGVARAQAILRELDSLPTTPPQAEGAPRPRAGAPS